MASAAPAARRKPSQVRHLLEQAELERGLQHSPVGQRSSVRRGASSEFARLRTSLHQLRLEASGARHEEPASEVAAASRLSAMQRAVEAVSDALEEEANALHASDAQQWEQLRLQAAQIGDGEAVRAGIDALGSDIRGVRRELEALRSGEVAELRRELGSARAEAEAAREADEAKDARAALLARAKASPAPQWGSGSVFS